MVNKPLLNVNIDSVIDSVLPNMAKSHSKTKEWNVVLYRIQLDANPL